MADTRADRFFWFGLASVVELVRQCAGALWAGTFKRLEVHPYVNKEGHDALLLYVMQKDGTPFGPPINDSFLCPPIC